MAARARRPGRRRRGALAVVAMVVLVVGLLGGGTASPPELGSEPRVLHPVVIDDSVYLDGGYANGAQLLTLPGNAVGVSADRSIIATRTTGGAFTGYRLRGGAVAWNVNAEQILAHGCEGWASQPGVYWEVIADLGYAWCSHYEGGSPHAILDLQTGRWTEFDFSSRYPAFDYLGFVDSSLYIVVPDRPRGQVSLIRVGLDGREVSTVPLFKTSTDDERDWAACTLMADRIACSRRDRIDVFDRATGAIRASLPSGRVTPTTDGYRVRQGDDSGFFYDLKGGAVGPVQSEDECDFIPGSYQSDQDLPVSRRFGSVQVLYSNADYEAQTVDCGLKLIGPSGRVFVEWNHADSYVVLPQAQVKLGQRSRLSKTAISGDEQVLVLLPQHDSDDGIRLVNPASGELISSFSLPDGYINNGIVFWTERHVNPDSVLGTQVLVPQGQR